MKAFLFPGQGTQKVGMGTLLLSYPGVRATFAEASETLGYDMTRLCLYGPASKLNSTEYTQPALVTCSVAALRILQSAGIEAEWVAGHSVGEFAALVAAGALTFRDALKAVDTRGKLMASVKTPGRMAAIVGLNESQVEQICQSVRDSGAASIALYNSPSQYVVSGPVQTIISVQQRCLGAGALRVLPLDVSQAFHSVLMLEVAAEWSAYIEALPLQQPAIPMVLNTTAREAVSVEDTRQGLLSGLVMPVRWTETIRRLVALGVESAVEVGDSNTLTGLNRSIDPGLPTLSMENPAVVKTLSRRLSR